MLELKIKVKDQIDPTGNIFYLQDDTGTYNASTNPGGYTSPNIQRNQMAIYPIGVMINSKGVETPVVFEPYSPLTSTSWNAKVGVDGYYKFFTLYIRTIDDLSYVDDPYSGLVLYNTTDNKIYYFGANDIGDDVWMEGTVTQLALFSTFLPKSNILEVFHVPHTILQKIDLNKRKTEFYIDSENLSNVRKIRLLQEEYDRIRGVLQSAIYQFQIGNKFVACRFLEFLQTNNYKDFNDLLR